ncbi:MAG: hypothetical protein NVS4B8_16490 [Herpetosiphon sp.]
MLDVILVVNADRSWAFSRADVRSIQLASAAAVARRHHPIFGAHAAPYTVSVGDGNNPYTVAAAAAELLTAVELLPVPVLIRPWVHPAITGFVDYQDRLVPFVTVESLQETP